MQVARENKSMNHSGSMDKAVTTDIKTGTQIIVMATGSINIPRTRVIPSITDIILVTPKGIVVKN